MASAIIAGTNRLWTIVILLLLLFSMAAMVSSYSSPLATNEDIDKIHELRKQDLIRGRANPEMVELWRNTLSASGIWSNVDYTAGCPARRANWPAQDHFQRIITMAVHWHENQTDVDLLQKISLAMDYWFTNDFTDNDCINAGGWDSLNCKCETPGFWNTNWYCQMILMPGLVGNACILLKSNLTEFQFNSCIKQLQRAYKRIDGDPNGSMGPMTGANVLDVSSTAVNLAVLSYDAELLESALNRYYLESEITPGWDDGIKVDGSFLQHSSQIYNGNYGHVFMNALLKIFLQTDNTTLITPPSVQASFLTVINGSEWFMFLKDEMRNDSAILMWQYSVIGRMVSHKYEDWRGIGVSLNEVIKGTESWDNHQSFVEIVDRLRNEKSRQSREVNPGPLTGTRYFHIADYLVHRGPNYIVTLKMFSKRTTNSECNNNQNPFGFHLSDGAIYTFLDGFEYVNVYGAWDWDMIPGTTVSYGGSELRCGAVQFKGVEQFVGAVSLGHAGVAVMNYTNPMTQAFHWEKTYFFFPNSYAVQFLGDVVASTPVLTTLDQRQLEGDVYIDGLIMSSPQVNVSARSVWHDRVGYAFQNPVPLLVDISSRPSNWSAIGISMGTDLETLFSAAVLHPSNNAEALGYIAYLGVEQTQFHQMLNAKTSDGSKVEFLRDHKVPGKANAEPRVVVKGALYTGGADTGERIIGLAFWESGFYETGLDDILAVSSDQPILLILSHKVDNSGWTLAVADPTQSQSRVNVNIYLGGAPILLSIELPVGAWAGSTVLREFGN